MHQAKRICLLVLSIYLSEVTAQNFGNFYNPDFKGGIGCGSHDLGLDPDPHAIYMDQVDPTTPNGLLDKTATVDGKVCSKDTPTQATNGAGGNLTRLFKALPSAVTKKHSRCNVECECCAAKQNLT